MFIKEILVENPSRCNLAEGADVRLILIEKDEDGCRSVMDIVECPLGAVKHWVDCWDFDDVIIHESHSNIDTGRAVKISSKVLKIAEALIKESK